MHVSWIAAATDLGLILVLIVHWQNWTLVTHAGCICPGKTALHLHGCTQWERLGMLHGMLLTGRGRTEAKERQTQNKKTTLGRTVVQRVTRNIFQKFKKKKNDIKNLIGCSKIICLGLSDVPVWEWRRYQWSCSCSCSCNPRISTSVIFDGIFLGSQLVRHYQTTGRGASPFKSGRISWTWTHSNITISWGEHINRNSPQTGHLSPKLSVGGIYHSLERDFLIQSTVHAHASLGPPHRRPASKYVF